MPTFLRRTPFRFPILEHDKRVMTARQRLADVERQLANASTETERRGEALARAQKRLRDAEVSELVGDASVGDIALLREEVATLQASIDAPHIETLQEARRVLEHRMSIAIREARQEVATGALARRNELARELARCLRATAAANAALREFVEGAPDEWRTELTQDGVIANRAFDIAADLSGAMTPGIPGGGTVASGFLRDVQAAGIAA